MPHNENCGCGHEDANIQPDKTHAVPMAATDNQKDFLLELSHHHYLPVARFSVRDSRHGEFIATALAPVFIRATSDDMATVKQAGAFLQKLEEMNLITIDYDMPLNGYGYLEYKESALYAYFCDTVSEGAKKPDFLGDTPMLELGSMALTAVGEQIATAHANHKN